MAAKPHAGGPAPALAPEHLAALEAELEKTPDATQAELAERLRALGAPRVSRSTIRRAVAQLTHTPKTSHGWRASAIDPT